MPDEETITLFRPVGEKELALIRQSGHREFPPRLPQLNRNVVGPFEVVAEFPAPSLRGEEEGTC